LRIPIKILLWVIAGLAVLLITLVVLLQTCWFQNIAVDKATSWLSKKIKATVTLEEVNISFPKSLYLKNFFIADLKGDTLLQVHELTVDINMRSLLSSEAVINSLALKGVTAHLYRTIADSSFNFDFIVNSFSTKDKKTEAVPSNSTPFNLILGKVKLEQIMVTLSDEVTGIEANGNLGLLAISFNEFNLVKEIVSVDQLTWSDSRVHYSKSKAGSSDTTAASPVTWQLAANHIQLAKLDLFYSDTTSQITLASKINKLQADPDTIDLANLIFDFKKLQIAQSSFAVAIGGVPAPDEAAAMPDTVDEGVMVRCDAASLQGFDFRYDNRSVAPAAKGIDYNHLDVKNITAEVSHIFYQGINIKADIHQLKAAEKSGFLVQQAYGKFRMSDKGIGFDSCLLITGKSTIRNSAGITYSSLEDINVDIGKLGIYGTMKNATIALSDLLYFYPPLADIEYVKSSLDRRLTVDGSFSGSLDNLLFKGLKVKTGATELIAAGRIKGLPDVDKMEFEVSLTKFSSTNTELLSLMPDSLIPSSIQLPKTFTLSGNFTGTMGNFKTAAVLQSSFGNAIVVASMQQVVGDSLPKYNAQVDLENFNLGKMLQQEEQIGYINMSVSAIGAGLELEVMNADITADIKSLELMGYEYRDAKVNGTIADQAFLGEITIDDDAIAFTFKGKAGLDIDHPEHNFNLDITYLDLQELNLYDQELKFAGNIAGNFTGNDLKSMNGHIAITGATVAARDQLITLDSIDLLATSIEGKYDWKLRSPVVDANYRGTSSATVGIPMLVNHFNYYFNRQAYREADTLGSQQFDFDISIHDNVDMLPFFVNGLNDLNPVVISGSFDSKTKKLELTSSRIDANYSGIVSDSLVLSASSDPERLNYSITADRIQKDTLLLEGVSLKGYLQHDSITAFLTVAPTEQDTALLLGGSLATTGENYRLHLWPDQLIFNNVHWSVEADNYFQYGTDGVLAHGMKIFNDSSYIKVQSVGDVAGAPLDFSFSNFDLGMLSGIADSSEQLLSGLVNGNFLLNDVKTSTFSADLTIQELSVLGKKYGNLDLDAVNEEKGLYDIKLGLLGAGNGIAIEGYYKAEGNTKELHFDADIDSAAFSLVEPFAQPYLRDLKGSMNGKLRIRGTTDAPSINGTIRFDSARFIVSYTNSELMLGSEPVTLDDSGIQFNAFTVIDPMGNKAFLNGNLYTTDYIDYQFALNAKATDFVAMNSTKEVKTEYYGMIRLDFLASVRGSIKQPEINIALKLREGSDFNYIYQRFDTSFNSEEGMVEFIDMDQRLSLLLLEESEEEPLLSGYSITVIAEVDDKSQFNIIVDPVAGDKLTVNGNGSFNFEIAPSGRMSLSGRYEISKGNYSLTLYELVKKQFILDKGSYINWSGDLIDADIDIKGHMDVRTSPYPLIGAQVAGSSEEQQAQYKNPLDFDVYLIMQDKLLEPEISFDIQLDPKDAGALDGMVDAKLLELQKMEGEMNKQVFSLMVLGTFVAEDPTAGTGAGEYINDFAKSSVSSLMSSQLNRLSGQYIKGVDLSFDLKSVTDYSSGVEEEKTQMNVGVREQLFNDRLQIYVGTNFDIGGSETFSAKPSDISGDFSLEYLLKADGRTRLNLSRKSTYEGAFEGQAIETSLALIYNRDYNSLRQLFTARKEAATERKKRKEIGQEEEGK
jgi:translocation and assembly module TamB